MSTKVTINGKNYSINKNTDPRVTEALENLVKVMSIRQWPIGITLEHVEGDSYVLTRIKQNCGPHRAYLINKRTGVARNSRKVVKVIDPKGGEFGRGYVETLPAEKDRFWDPDNPGCFIDD